MRRAMKLLTLTCLLTLLTGGRPATADMNEMLNASAWELEWEVEFKAVAERPESSMYVTHHTVTLESSFSATLLLNMRNAGSNLGMLKLAMTMPKGTTPTAEQQKQLMDMIMRTDVLANWMYAPPGALEDLPEPDAESGTDQPAQASGTGTAQLTYTEVVTGTDLVDDFRKQYNYHKRTTRTGSGPITVPTQLVFELDAEAKHYMVSLAHEYRDPTDSAATIETVEKLEYVDSDPVVTTTTERTSLQYPSRIVIDEPTRLFGDILFFEGPIDPAAPSITGEGTVKAYYEELAWTIPGTIHVRYTLTPK